MYMYHPKIAKQQTHKKKCPVFFENKFPVLLYQSRAQWMVGVLALQF